MDLSTRDKLIKAAQREIDSSDFFSTDTNKIAREAGFAPATFYKHFKDKQEVFLEIYRQWYEAQRSGVKTLIEKVPSLSELPSQLVEVILPHYTRHPGFRSSVKALAQQDSRIQNFRTENFEANMKIMNFVMKIYKLPPPSRAKCFTFILQMEKLCDAIALGEYKRMRISEKEAKAALESLFAQFFVSE